MRALNELLCCPLSWPPVKTDGSDALGQLRLCGCGLSKGYINAFSAHSFSLFDMQRITLEELKHILFHAFRDHLTMKDIENIIINEEESLNENSGNCQTDPDPTVTPDAATCAQVKHEPWRKTPPPRSCARNAALFRRVRLADERRLNLCFCVIAVHPKKKNRQTCVRKSLICAFAMAFIISVMLIAANQMLRNGME
ncbi:Calcium-binding protein 8 [Labeo rohita]|uniref:Calcium-binding protein 8 n=1 Tax=Labeo rohita TaxID=84645 RepID=A0ABQ8LZX0_LABRO|nr:Calcium-binding protein 8 [Labeo rohita]